MSEHEFGGGFASNARAGDDTRHSRSGDPPRGDGQGTRTEPGGVPGPRTEPAGTAPSVVEEDIDSGRANVTGGVTRRRRRVVRGLSVARLGRPVGKNYRTTDAVMFNNFDEMVQDRISREYGQEILEELFDKWGVPVEQPEAAKYAEDLVWTFLIAVTASNKADYHREFDVPLRKGSVTVGFSVLSDLLEAVHGVTRRQFARAVADDLRDFIRHEENQFMVPALATRIGCDPQLAHLAFDGSTHCTGMTSREIAFTKTLEARNLFEDDAVLASGASERLMQGPSGGPRSIKPR